MVRRTWRHWQLIALLGVCLAVAPGCSGPDPDEAQRPDQEWLDGKADVPSYFKDIQASWGCGETVQGKFQGLDSAHSYSFELKQGYLYTFELSASYPASKGAAVAIYDKSSGKRVALDRQPGRTSAAASFKPQQTGTHVVGAYSIAWYATGDYSLRAVCQPVGLNELEPGQSDFTNLELQHPSFHPYRPLAKSATAPEGRSGEVEEGDTYKIVKNRLYTLNTYRGFMIFDISNPKQPQLLSRLPVFGYPVEMYVQSNTVYALIRDALYLTQKQGAPLRFKRHNVSQLVALDITSETKPKVLSTTDIVGELREGVSRKIGDSIYVVSHVPQWYSGGWRRELTSGAQQEQAWVYSFNVTDPKSAKLVDKLQVFLGGSYQTSDGSSSASRCFGSLALSATADTLLVVENWTKYGAVYGAPYSCGTSESLQQAVVSIIDISSTSGKIRLHTKFETYGELGDQFKQSYLVDKATGKATYLGLFARREWKSTDCQGQSVVANALEAWDVTVGATPKKLSSLAFGKPNETIRGSAFDVDRRVAFAITAEQIDPLYALSFADPKNLKVLSEVDGLSGDMNVFRFIADKKFLIGIGRDTSTACTGFGSPATGWAANVAVSIIDVQDLAKIRLVQRKCVTVNDASWISSEVNWNLDQAHKMIGLHSDALVNLVTIPVYYTKKVSDAGDGGGWWYTQETAVGMMGWDLTKYDSTKDETQQQVLQSWGTVVHPQGLVRRSVVFTHQGQTARRKLLNLSNTHLALVDIENLALPTTDAVVEVAPFRAALYRFGNYMVEQVQPGWEGNWNEQQTEFRVKNLGSGLDSAPVLASFKVGGVSRALRFKDTLVLLRQVQSAQDWHSELTVYDLSQPLKPKLAGSTKLPLTWVPWWSHRLETRGYWAGSDRSTTVTTSGLVFLKSEWNDKTQSTDTSLVFVDLTAPAKPAVLEQALPADAQRSYLELTRGGGSSVYVTYREKLGDETVEGTTFEKLRYYARPYYAVGGKWLAGPALNVPGRLVDIWSSYGLSKLLTRDSTYELTKDGQWQESERLNLSWAASSKAVLQDSTRLTGLRVHGAVREGSKLYVVAGQVGGWSPGPSPLTKMQLAYPVVISEDQLQILDLQLGRFDRLFAQAIGTESADLLAVQQGRLLLGLGSDGVLVVDAATPTKPFGQQFLRTFDVQSEFEFVGSKAYLPAGYFGIYEFDAGGSSQLTIE